MKSINELMDEAIERSARKAELKSRFKQIDQELERERRLKSVKSAKTRKMGFWIMGIAASLLLLIGGYYIMTASQTTAERLYATYYHRPDLRNFESLGSSTIAPTADPNAWKEAYKAENFERTITELEQCLSQDLCAPFSALFLAVAFLELEEPKAALERLDWLFDNQKGTHGDDALVRFSEIYYFRSLAYLQLGKLVEAREALANLTTDSSKDKTYITIAKARALKKALEEAIKN